MKKTSNSTEILDLIGRSFFSLSAGEPRSDSLIAGALHIKGAFLSILLKNQHIFRAVHAVKIAHRYKPSNKTIPLQRPSVTRPYYSQ